MNGLGRGHALFKVEDAYRFAAQHGLDGDAREIRSMRIHPSIKYRHVPRKGAFVELFERKGIMDEFARLYWPGRETPDGQARRQRYLDAKVRNDALLQGAEPDDELLDADNEVDAAATSEAELVAFAMEAHLRDFLVENIARVSIDGRRLRLYVDSSGRNGREYPTDVGPIDILAVDEAGNFFVFELKLKHGPDRALGQLARYMGWVKVHLAQDHEVRGVVVAQKMDDRLRYAACIMPNVALLEYEVDFKLHPAEHPNKILQPTVDIP